MPTTKKDNFKYFLQDASNILHHKVEKLIFVAKRAIGQVAVLAKVKFNRKFIVSLMFYIFQFAVAE